MQLKKSVLLNLAGGGWNAALILLTTPWYVARLGLEGFGIVAFWQLLFYLALVCDFGLGAACAREFSRYLGTGATRADLRRLLPVFERAVLAIAVAITVLLYAGAGWLAVSWLRVTEFPPAEVERSIQFMAASVAGQFVAAFYGNALAGLQRQGRMNALQIVGSTLRYLGGAIVLTVGGGLVAFFAWQVGAALAMAIAARVVLSRTFTEFASGTQAGREVGLRGLLVFSGGMFFTAACAALVANADRMAVSRLLPAADLGRYSLALTAIGLLQILVFSFHRVYFPKFCELSASGDRERLRDVYLQGCTAVGLVVLPLAALFIAFTPELYRLWVGWSDAETVFTSRLLVIGFALSALMWLPAAYQQAIGWTRLHASLMAATLLVGVPLVVAAIRAFGLPGAPALLLMHGAIGLLVGLVLMNRVCFPGETLAWYRRVLMWPLVLSAPWVMLAWWLRPEAPDRLGIVVWVAVASLLTAGATAWPGLRLLRRGTPV